MSASIEIDRVVEAHPADVLAAIRGTAEWREGRISRDLRADGVTSVSAVVRGNTFTVEFGVTHRQNGRAELTGTVRQEGSGSRIVARCGSVRGELYTGVVFAILAIGVGVWFRQIPLVLLLATFSVIQLFEYYSPPPGIAGQIAQLKLGLDRALDALGSASDTKSA